MALTAWRSRSAPIGLSWSSWRRVRQRISTLGVSSEWLRHPFEKTPPMIALQNGGAPYGRDEMDHGRNTLILRGRQIDLVILRRHDKLPAPLESACRWLSFFPLIKSSLKCRRPNAG